MRSGESSYKVPASRASDRPDPIAVRQHAKCAGASAATSASADAVWQQVAAIGGDNRYFCCNLLWKIREIIDWIAGGPGLNYGRRHPSELRMGDAVDSWRVIGLEPGRRLTLLMGMKAPGAGVLEFEIAPTVTEPSCQAPPDR
jgi:hypothetical protein